MTPKERAAMRQALDALHNTQNALLFVSGSIEQFIISKMTADAHDDADKAITALREALAEQAEQEPVGHLCEASFGRGQVFWFNKPADNTPLYAAPVRTKDLTDDELLKIWQAQVPASNRVYEFARAVIAADREKNK